MTKAQAFSLFITVDPERDTVEAMGKYVSLPPLAGRPDRHGGADQRSRQGLQDLLRHMQDESMSDYTMDHSSFIYFIAPDDRLLHIFRMEDLARTMADIISAGAPPPPNNYQLLVKP